MTYGGSGRNIQVVDASKTFADEYFASIVHLSDESSAPCLEKIRAMMKGEWW